MQPNRAKALYHDATSMLLYQTHTHSHTEPHAELPIFFNRNLYHIRNRRHGLFEKAAAAAFHFFVCEAAPHTINYAVLMNISSDKFIAIYRQATRGPMIVTEVCDRSIRERSHSYSTKSALMRRNTVPIRDPQHQHRSPIGMTK